VYPEKDFGEGQIFNLRNLEIDRVLKRKIDVKARKFELLLHIPTLHIRYSVSTGRDGHVKKKKNTAALGD